MKYIPPPIAASNNAAPPMRNGIPALKRLENEEEASGDASEPWLMKSRDSSDSFSSAARTSGFPYRGSEPGIFAADGRAELLVSAGVRTGSFLVRNSRAGFAGSTLSSRGAVRFGGLTSPAISSNDGPLPTGAIAGFSRAVRAGVSRLATVRGAGATDA